jgi:hypothetical protein
MTKFVSRLTLSIVFIVTIMTIGCSRTRLENQSAPTLPSLESSSIPSLTPFAILPTPHPGTSTPGNEVETSQPNYLCERVPEPELSKTANSNNIYLSGKFYLCTFDGTQIAFDFDSGKLGSIESAITDIKLVISGASIDNRSLYFLQETNNSYVAVSELILPTQEYCEQQTMATNRLKLVLSSIGAIGCVLTNDGRLAFFQVERLDPFGLESVEVSFTTWNKK